MNVRDGRWSAVLLEAGPIVGLIVLAILTADPGRRGDSDASLFNQLVVIAPLVARRRWPFATLVAIAGLAVITSITAPTPWVQILAVSYASFSAGLLSGDRVRSATGTIGIAALMTVGFLAQEGDPMRSLVLPFVIVVPSWLLGDVLRARRLESLRLAREAEAAARDAERRLSEAATDERRRVARELHDVVSHAVSVMVIQAGAARQVLDRAPGQAEESLLSIEATGREAMDDLRAFLGVLNDDPQETGLAPQPGVDRLGALVERVREAGLPAALEVDGLPRALPASLDVTVYRIVQEALTNALRHAQRAATLVRLSYEPSVLRLEVLDDGPAVDTESVMGSGRGVVGMRERASLVGGRLEAGPRIGGGYAVRAWLPLEPELP